jgi:TolB protein
MKQIFTLAVLLSLAAFNMYAQDCNNYWAVVSPDGNYLYFSSDRQGEGWDIYRCNIDGSNLLHLTNFTGNELYPSVSPDGSKVLFQHGDYGALADIYVMNNDGSEVTRLTNNSKYDGFPSYSPDGEQILFSAWDANYYPEIFLMDTDGSNTVQLTSLEGAFWNSAPRFHPSGEKIYFLAGFNADDHLAMINTDGTGWVDITEVNTFGYGEANIFFNADGSKMTFFTTENLGYNNGGDLVKANTDGTNWTYLSNAAPGEYYYQASFHPNNGKLYVTHMPSASEKWNIYTMQQDGSNLVPLTNCSLTGLNEGEQIAKVELKPNPVHDIMTVAVAGILGIRDVEIVSLTGQTIQTIEWMNNPSQRIDLSTLREGVYFCRISGENTTVTRKFMVVR